jgi:hypothetical protein
MVHSGTRYERSLMHNSLIWLMLEKVNRCCCTPGVHSLLPQRTAPLVEAQGDEIMMPLSSALIVLAICTLLLAGLIWLDARQRARYAAPRRAWRLRRFLLRLLQ